MADGTATFRLSLENEMTGQSAQAVTSLEELRSQLRADTGELQAMENALRALTKAQIVDEGACSSLSGKILAQKQKVADLNGHIVRQGASFTEAHKATQTLEKSTLKLGTNLAKVDNPAKEASKKLRALAQVSKGLGSELGGPLRKMAMLTKGLGALGPAGIVALAAIAVAGLGIGVIALTAALAHHAIGVVDAANKQWMLFAAMTGSAAGGAALVDIVESVSATVPIASSKVAELAGNLYKSGLRGDALKKALEGASMESAGLGKKTKIGSTLALEAMLPLSVQAEKFHEKIAGLFRDVKVVPFERALQQVIGLFDKSTVTGKAFKTMIEGLLNPIFGQADDAGASLEDMFEKATILALRAELYVLNLADDIKKFVSGQPDFPWLEVLSVGLWLANIAFTGLKNGLKETLNLLSGIGAAIGWAVRLFEKCSAAIKASDWAGLGKAIITGVVDGLEGLGGWLVNTALNKFNAVKDTIKAVFGIHSPSTFGIAVGANVTAATATGFDRGAPKVQAAAKNALTPAPIPPMAPPKYAGGESGSPARGVPAAPAERKGASIRGPLIGVLNYCTGGDGEKFSMEKLCEQLEEAAHMSGINLDPEDA